MSAKEDEKNNQVAELRHRQKCLGVGVALLVTVINNIPGFGKTHMVICSAVIGSVAAIIICALEKRKNELQLPADKESNGSENATTSDSATAPALTR